MNKRKFLILIITIIAVLTSYNYMFSSSFQLDTSNISVAETGCGDLSLADLNSQISSQGIRLEFNVSEYEVGICKIYSFTTVDGYQYSITDAGEVFYEKS